MNSIGAEVGISESKRSNRAGHFQAWNFEIHNVGIWFGLCEPCKYNLLEPSSDSSQLLATIIPPSLPFWFMADSDIFAERSAICMKEWSLVAKVGSKLQCRHQSMHTSMSLVSFTRLLVHIQAPMDSLPHFLCYSLITCPSSQSSTLTRLASATTLLLSAVALNFNNCALSTGSASIPANPSYNLNALFLWPKGSKSERVRNKCASAFWDRWTMGAAMIWRQSAKLWDGLLCIAA